jgi:hypothetical protein
VIGVFVGGGFVAGGGVAGGVSSAGGFSEAGATGGFVSSEALEQAIDPRTKRQRSGREREVIGAVRVQPTCHPAFPQNLAPACAD